MKYFTHGVLICCLWLRSPLLTY